MLILKADKFRLEPTPEQTQRLRQMCGYARFVWNHGLAETQRIIESGGNLPSAFELNRMLTVWKKMPEHAFLRDAYTDNLQQKLKDLHGAWKHCFDKKLAAKAPVWKRKNDGRDSIRFVNFDKYSRLENRRVKLPFSLGWVRFRQSQSIFGKIKNATISQSAGQWYISFQVEIETTEPSHVSTTMVGLDAGITKLATLSDGTIYEPVNSFKSSQRCACCGHTAKENRLSQSKFECLECGYTENADINGARNILAAEHAVLACEVNGAVMPSAAGTRQSSDLVVPH